MGLGVDGVMIVHGGGVYEDKGATIERIKETITRVLPKNVRERLALDNDQLCYNAQDLLPLCEELDVPLVFGKSRNFAPVQCILSGAARITIMMHSILR